MAIGGYSINGILLVVILWMIIGCYFINDYWLLFYEWLLVVILSMIIGCYFINDYWLLFY